MSKVEILEEIAKLTPDERDEIWMALCSLEEREMLSSSTPTEYEKAILDREWEDYQKNPWKGSTWEEVEARLRQKE